MGWGISPNASPKEKLKAELNDYLQGLNSTGEIDYSTYSDIFDMSHSILDKMYELGKSEGLQESLSKFQEDYKIMQEQANSSEGVSVPTWYLKSLGLGNESKRQKGNQIIQDMRVITIKDCKSCPHRHKMIDGTICNLTDNWIEDTGNAFPENCTLEGRD